MKETAVFRIPGIDAEHYEKDSAEFLNYIKNALNHQINDRLTNILDNGDELIIKKSQLSRDESFPEKDYYQVIYSYTIEHCPLVRCKDCRFSAELIPGLYICRNENIRMAGSHVDSDWYCADAKRKETNDE